MTRPTLSKDETPLHAEIDRIISEKAGSVLTESDLADLQGRHHPLAVGLTNLVNAKHWSPSVFDLKSIEDLPNPVAQRLKSELLRLAVSRNDLAYLADAIVIHRHKSKVNNGLESASKTIDLLSTLDPEAFPLDSVNFVIDNFSTPERRTASTQRALFKFLGSQAIHSRLDEISRNKLLKTFLDPRSLPAEKSKHVQQVLVNSLMTTEADFECLRFDLDLFKKVADHLATNEKDFTKGKRKIFLDWLTGTKDRDLLTIEEAWRGLDVVDRLAVIANVPDALLQDFLYTNLISPQLKSPTASTLLRIAVSEPKLIARVIIESIDMEAMKRLVDWGSDPKKKIPDPAELLLNRASKVSFSVAEDALKTAADAEEQLRKTISQLGKEELAHRATAEALDAAERKVADLERLVKYEADSRREALQSEIEVAQFATLKELCLVHRGLLLATKLVGETPKEFREVTKWTQRGLEGLGVEVFGLPGEIVPCDLVLHEARAPKGADVEILQVGYIMRVSRVVVLPALAQLVAKG